MGEVLRRCLGFPLLTGCLLLSGCSGEQQANKSDSSPEPQLGQYSPVTAKEIASLQLNHYFTKDGNSHGADFDWSFTDNKFTIKAGKGAIPEDLIEKLLPPGTAAKSIEGKWTLNGSLVLADIKADGKPGLAQVSLAVWRTAPTVIRIGRRPEYVFGIDWRTK